MEQNSTTTEAAPLFAGQAWFDPIEAELRERVRQFLEESERLFTFTRLPESQWKSARTTNTIERLHEEFKRRIKTQTVLPSAEAAAMLFWAELPKVPRAQRVEWQRRGYSRQARSTCARSTVGRCFPRRPSLNALTSPLDPISSPDRRRRQTESSHKSRGHPVKRAIFSSSTLRVILSQLGCLALHAKAISRRNVVAIAPRLC